MKNVDLIEIGSFNRNLQDRDTSRFAIKANIVDGKVILCESNYFTNIVKSSQLGKLEIVKIGNTYATKKR
jgi:hypothetical protein